MKIVPLPVFEADADPYHRAAMSDEEIYARLEPPKTIVVRFGLMKLVGEFPHDGAAKPGCGSKLVARTHRGTELVEMLTTTCSNSGCSKSISRHELLDYVENSGGRDFPFHTKGRILRVATIEDLNKQSSLDSLRKECVKTGKALIAELNMPMKLVEVEPILGGEQITFYYMSEARVDFRELVQRLAGEFRTRIEMRQVGARDEARLVADYERCGQHCCCKNFLKVLKPVSMKAAKMQKATLDTLKISGRCGRLMCCLRYEDQTYRELKTRLPPKNKRVGTSEGPGVVIDGKILVQLVLVRLEHDNKEIAVPVEELLDPETCPKPGETAKAAAAAAAAEADPFRGLSPEEAQQRGDDRHRKPRHERKGRDRERRSKDQQQDAYRRKSQEVEREGQTPAEGTRDATSPPPPEQPQASQEGGGRRKKRRRRRRRRRGGPGGEGGGPPSAPPTS